MDANVAGFCHKNPIGTFFDPARVYEKFLSGADFKALQKTIRAGAPSFRTRFPTLACQRRNAVTANRAQL